MNRILSVSLALFLGLVSTQELTNSQMFLTTPTDDTTDAGTTSPSTDSSVKAKVS